MEKLYIVCVDDQREVLSSVVRDLKVFHEWTVVEECESAAEARDLMEELDVEGTPLALVVCDHIMPGGNGVDFLTSLAQDVRFTFLKKILLTGQATHKDTIDAVNQAHIDYYFEKPWQAELFQDIVRRLLTEYLFDTGRFDSEFRQYADPKVLLARLRGRE